MGLLFQQLRLRQQRPHLLRMLSRQKQLRYSPKQGLKLLQLHPRKLRLTP
jgi:hypothetical protein